MNTLSDRHTNENTLVYLVGGGIASNQRRLSSFVTEIFPVKT